jgi:hypothetical protein
MRQACGSDASGKWMQVLEVAYLRGLLAGTNDEREEGI